MRAFGLVFEILGLEIQRKFVDLFLRIDGFLNFLASQFAGVINFARSIVAAASLHGIFILFRQLHAEQVVLAVHLGILGRKREHVGILGSESGKLQSALKIIRVVEEGAAGAVGQVAEHVLVFLLRGDTVHGLLAGG